jgi:hypothetical protein
MYEKAILTKDIDFRDKNTILYMVYMVIFGFLAIQYRKRDGW